MTYYKFFRKDGRTYHNRDPWPLPRGRRPGKWAEPYDLLFLRGLHVMRECDLPFWPGPLLYEVEVAGTVDGESKPPGWIVYAEKARLTRRVKSWDEQALRSWLVDCAEHVLPYYGAVRPGDVTLLGAVGAVRALLRERNDATLRQVTDAAAAIRAAAPSVAPSPDHSRRAARGVIAAVSDAVLAAAFVAAADSSCSASAVVHAARYGASAAAAAACAVAVVNGTTSVRDHSYAYAEHRWQTERMLAYIRGELKP